MNGGKEKSNWRKSAQAVPGEIIEGCPKQMNGGEENPIDVSQQSGANLSMNIKIIYRGK